MQSLIFLSCAIAYASAAATWSYDYSASNGPNDWGTLAGFSLCGNGSRQTPVNIDRSSTVMTSFPSLAFSGATGVADWVFGNNGHSIEAKPSADVWLRGGPLNSSKTYKVYNIHIHFGNSTFVASEHALDSTRTTGEFHIVTYDSTFSDVGAAIASGLPDALSVYGVLFQAQTGQTIDAGITTLIQTTSNLTYAGDEVVNSLNFSTMVSDLDLQRYFAYDGGLTTPGCGEVVSWIVADRVHYVSPTVMDSLMGLNAGTKASPSISLFGNTRPLQDLNGRIISRSFEFTTPGPTTTTASGSVSTLMSANTFSLLASIMVTLTLRN